MLQKSLMIQSRIEKNECRCLLQEIIFGSQLKKLKLMLELNLPKPYQLW